MAIQILYYCLYSAFFTLYCPLEGNRDTFTTLYCPLEDNRGTFNMSQASASSWVKPPMDRSAQDQERAERAEQREFQKLRDKLDRLEAWEASQTGLGRQEEVVYVGQTEEAQQQQ